MEWILWPLFGAFVLFFVPRIFSRSRSRRKCPSCAEWIREEATVCKHCHREVPQMMHGVTLK